MSFIQFPKYFQGLAKYYRFTDLNSQYKPRCTGVEAILTKDGEERVSKNGTNSQLDFVLEKAWIVQENEKELVLLEPKE